MSSLLSPRLLLVDTCAWIAYLVGEEPGCSEVRGLFEECARQDVTMLYAPTTLKDVFYIVPRRLRRDAVAAGEDVEGLSFAPAAWACVRTMTEIAVAAPQALPECDLAWMLRHEHDDFEDNLILACAETCGADYVVTFDKLLLERFSPACITPAQALSLLWKSPRGVAQKRS